MYTPDLGTQCLMLPLFRGRVISFVLLGSKYSTAVSWDDMKVIEKPVCLNGGTSARSDVIEIL